VISERGRRTERVTRIRSGTGKAGTFAIGRLRRAYGS
jgi:hypothetical protein